MKLDVRDTEASLEFVIVWDVEFPLSHTVRLAPDRVMHRCLHSLVV